MAAQIGLPFDEDAADECLDGRNNSCGMLTMENNVVEEKQLNTTYTFFGQHFQSLFVSFFLNILILTSKLLPFRCVKMD